MTARLIFAHGLEGSPSGTKAQALRRSGLEVDCPDFQGLVLALRVARLDQLTREAQGPLVLAGSSYGGLAAAWLAMQFPKRFAGLLLFAPALGHAEPPSLFPDQLVAPRGLPTVIVHGRRDRVVPIASSLAYQRRSGPHVRVVEVDDDHRLAASIDVIVAEAAKLCMGAP